MTPTDPLPPARAPAPDPAPAPAQPPQGRAGQRRVLARNAAWTWGSFVLNGVALFFVMRYLVRDLGDAAYGFWSFFMSLVGTFGLADLGVRPAIVHFVARHDALGDAAGLNRHVNAAFAVFAAAGLVLLLVVLALAAWLPGRESLGSVAAGDAAAVILVLGGEVALTFPFNAFSAVLIGRQRFDVVARIDVVLLVLRTLVTILLVEHGHGLVALAFTYAVSGVVEIAWKTWAAFRTCPDLRFAPRLADRAALRALLGYGGWAVLISVALMLTWQIDPLVIGAALTMAHVTYFTVPASLPSQARALLWSACRVLAPAAGALEARGDREELTRLLVQGGRLMLLLAGPIAAYLITVGEPFLVQWHNEDFRGEPATVLTVLTLGALAPIASHPLVQVLYGVNRLRPLALTYLAEGCANLVLSLALAPRLGIVGVALGTAVPAFLVHALVLPAQLARAWGLSPLRLTLDTWALPLAAGAVTWGALELLTDRSTVYGWPALAGWALAAVALQAVAAGLLLALARARPGAPRPPARRAAA